MLEGDERLLFVDFCSRFPRTQVLVATQHRLLVGEVARGAVETQRAIDYDQITGFRARFLTVGHLLHLFNLPAPTPRLHICAEGHDVVVKTTPARATPLLSVLSRQMNVPLPELDRLEGDNFWIDRVRLENGPGERHPHVAFVRVTRGSGITPSATVIHGIRYQNDTYTVDARGFPSAKLIVTSCPSCGAKDYLTTDRPGPNLLLELPTC